MTDGEPPSIARGFLFADLRGYSAWVERHGDQAASILIGEYRELVRRAVAEHRGAEIKTEGDSFYVVFDSPSMAVRCGLRVVELAAASSAAAGGPIPVGVGVHAGETVATDEGFVGSAVNVAARVCGQARAGELLVTDAVRSLTRTFLDVTFVARGRKRLKGISEPIGLYRVTPGTAAARPARSATFARRWPIAAAVIAIPVVLVVVALIGGALVRESAGETEFGPPSSAGRAAEVSASSAPSIAPGGAFPTADETLLLELIPERDRDRCQRTDPADSPVREVERVPGEPTVVRRTPFAASIECALGGISAPDRLWLWELTPPVPAPHPDPAHIAIAAHGGLVGAEPGTCRVTHPAIETWTFGNIGGTLVCYESSTGDAVLLWVYDEDTRLFARAVRDDRDMTALLDWWEDVGRLVAR